MRYNPYPGKPPVDRMSKSNIPGSKYPKLPLRTFPLRSDNNNNNADAKKPKLDFNLTPKTPLRPAKQAAKISASLQPPITAATSVPTPTITVTNIQLDPNLKTRPVIVEAKMIVLKNSIANTIFQTRPSFKITSTNRVTGNDRVMVTCHSLADKKALIKTLDTKVIPYTTYTEQSEKNPVFVLRRHYHLSCDEMLALLTEVNIPAIKVAFMRDDQFSPLYLVHFKAGEMDLRTLTHEHNAIDGLRIIWETIKSKKLTQCHRCQLYGHSSTNCGRTPRCVKCVHTHAISACERKDREGTASCINCFTENARPGAQQIPFDHAANSHVCPSYKRYKSLVDSKRQPQPPVQRQPQFFENPSQQNARSWANVGNPSNHQQQSTSNFQAPTEAPRQQPQGLSNGSNAMNSESIPEEGEFEQEDSHVQARQTIRRPNISARDRASRIPDRSFAMMQEQFSIMQQQFSAMQFQFNESLREVTRLITALSDIHLSTKAGKNTATPLTEPLTNNNVS